MPHTITTVITITRISLHTNGKGEEKITKTDKHHGTPTTRKLLPSKAGSLWQALRQCPLRTKAGTCGDTPNGNETALLAWLQRLQKNFPPWRVRGGRCDITGGKGNKNTFFFIVFTSHDHSCWHNPATSATVQRNAGWQPNNTRGKHITGISMRQATRGKGKQNEVDNSLQLKEKQQAGTSPAIHKVGCLLPTASHSLAQNYSSKTWWGQLHS